MKLKEAINRLGFTISKTNKPNQTDAEAFNFLVDYLKKSEAETIKENLLFAKLYTYLLQEFTSHYGNVDQANKQLNKLLSEPFDTRIEFLVMQLKSSELTQVLADNCLKNKPPEKVIEKLKEYPEICKTYLSCWDYWDRENVISHLNTNINLSIQNFKNNV